MHGETAGFVANRPMAPAGVLDCDSSDKAARPNKRAFIYFAQFIKGEKPPTKVLGFS
jgi:acetyl-CoA carboxylase carboxyltransferase component